jgi:hypothetical protein
MNYKDINDKWKSFLFENTFKEDKLIDPDKAKKKKKRKPEKKAEDGEKEIITNEWEEFEEWTLPSSRNEGTQSAGYNDAVDSVEEEQLEEMSAVSAGAIEGHAGGAGGSFMSKKAFKRKWS